jgi:tetratricopeptide (TPR) repeat protein
MQPAEAARFDVGHYLGVAVGYLRTGSPERAVEVALRGLAEHPEDAELLLLLGESSCVAGAWSAGRDALERAAGILPLPATPRLALAECYLRLGRLDEARVELKFLCGRGRSPAALLPGLGDALYRAGLYRPAARVWNRLRRDDPQDAEAHYRYALCLHELGGDPDRLFEPLHEAAMLRPDVPGYRIRLAEAWGGLGLFSEAAEELAELSPEEIDCECCLRRGARLLASAGREAEAARWLARRESLGCGTDTINGKPHDGETA